MTGLHVELLGPPHVTVDDEPIEVDTRKAIALLARLVVEGTQRRDRLVALLWPDSDETRGRASLRRTLSALNKGLDHRWVDADRDEVRLDTDGVRSDVRTFEELRDRADAHDHEDDAPCGPCLEALEEAVRLHRDDFMAGFHLRGAAPFEDWRTVQAEGFRRALLGSLDRLARIHARMGQLAAALDHARRRLQREPLHEPTHRMLMLLHAWKGQRGEAMRQYRDCVRVLERELGVAPLERTTQLHEAIVAGDTPDRPAPAPTVASDDPRQPSRTPISLVGRGAELERLQAAYEDSGRAGRLVLIEGEAGIGKTRLMDRFVADARGGGAAVAAIRCYEEEQTVAYAAAAELLRAAMTVGDLTDVPDPWLGEAARLAPELLDHRPDLEPAGTLDSAEARRRLLEGLRQVLVGTLVGPGPGIIAIDDVHWADDASSDALTYLLRRLEDVPLCVVVGARSRLLPSEHPLRRVVRDLIADERGSRIRLQRFDRDDVNALAEAMDTSVRPEVIARVAEESEGLPLFAVEYLRASDERDDTDRWSIPDGIRVGLERQVDRLTDGARQVVSTAAVIGRSFALDTLLEASGRDLEETVSAVEELCAAGIVTEIDRGQEPRYDFRHHKLRDVVYEDTSAARRRLLHRRVADVLRRRRPRGPDGRPSAGVVARHLRESGRTEEAARAYVEAADESLELSAHTEAIGHLREALELDHPDRGRLHERLGELLTLRGDYPAALHAYSAAAANLDDDTDLARIEHRIATVHERRGDWASAESHVEAGLEALPEDGPDPLRARLHTDRALVAYRRDQHDRARSEAERALELAADAGDDPAQAQALNLLGMLARADGDADEAVARLEESLAIAETLDDPSARIAGLNNLALAHADRDEHPAGLELAKTALGLCRRQGDRHREAALLNNVADLLHRAGQREEALDHLKQAVSIFAEVGEPDRHEPEIWKLVDW